MRRRGIVAAVVALSVLTACTSGTDEKAPLPVNPTPTKPGQVVVLAGNGKAGETRDGAYAVQTPVAPVGPIATTSDGSLYVPVKIAGHSDKSARIARIAPDGHLHLIGPILDWYRNDKIVGGDGKLWLLGTGPRASLDRYSVDGVLESTYFDPMSKRASDLVFVGHDGKPMSEVTQRRERSRWGTGNHQPFALALRQGGAPVIALASGELYEALGDGKVRRWDPPGYSAARDQIATAATGDPKNPAAFSVDLLLPDFRGGLYIGTNVGVIRIPAQGRASGVPIGYFEHSAHGLSWVGAAALSDGGLMLATGLDSDINSIIVQVDAQGNVTRQRPVWGQTCSEVSPSGRKEGRRLTGLAQRGIVGVAVADGACGHVLGVRLPAR